MKKILFLASIITVLISCQAPKQKETAQIDQKIVIGHEFNDKSEKLDIISGDVGLTSIWLDYMKAHNERDLDKIAEIDASDIEVYRADGTVGKGRKTHRQVLSEWFQTSNPNWKVVWMVTNSVEKNDGSMEHWLTTGNEFTDTVQGEQIMINVVADVNFLDGKIKRINIHNRAQEKQ
mgnify:FL=1